MRKAKLIHYGSTKVTKLILYGSLCVCFVLSALLTSYDIFAVNELRIRTVISIVALIYLGMCWLLSRKKYLRTVSWLLIVLYTGVAFATMLYWGLNAAAGIFATSFVIILAGILLGSRAIFPVSVCIGLLLFVVQTVHSLEIIVPNLTALHDNATFLDVISYITILSVFALITWISDNQIEKSFERTKAAETAVRSQKESIASELERESARLREIQLKEMQQLYKFATLGQSTAATLHELSNHLSVLTMDMDDIKQQHRNSRAIANAKEGIEQINLMVRQVRRQLNSYDDSKTFKMGPVIRRVLKDQSEKYKLQSIDVLYQPKVLGSTQIHGDPIALTQIITVLITNALDACSGLSNAKVVVSLAVKKNILQISVTDNGIGISDTAKKSLFSPTLSSKPSGMGVGLYIAKHLAESHFQGTISLAKNRPSQPNGAHFIVSIPLKER